MYKYNCRKCPVRNRCIEESANAPSIKEIVRHAFAARTDTLETWGLLQPGCLLLKAEEERAKTSPRESMLSRRLRQVREAREQAGKAIAMSTSQPPDYLRPVSTVSPPPAEPVSAARPDGIGVLGAQREAPSRERLSALPDQLAPRWLTAVASGRHVAMPSNKALILGRFDPNFGIPPDVDLSYEDHQARSVSRQHAKIVGNGGRHTIEDLGSRQGLSVNGEAVRSGPPRPLQLGDRISLGKVQLVYDMMPAYLLDFPLSAVTRHFLIVTPTGRKLTIVPPKDILIGRSDRLIDFVPDIDLGREGEVAVRVSRRHAIITWRNYVPHLEDLGSGFGTRLNGETLLMGQATPLRPGDHIWLGGCVLAYDIEV